MNDQRHKAAYAEEAEELLVELEAALLELEAAPEDQNLVGRIFRALHTLKGSGAMFGFDDIATFTHDVENVFDAVRNEELDVTPALLGMTLQAKDIIGDLLAAGVEGRQPDLAPGQALAMQFRELLPQAAGEEATTAGQSSQATQASEGTEAQAALWRIRFKPNSEMLFTGANPLALIEELQQLAIPGGMQIFPGLQGVKPLEELAPEEVYLQWDVVLQTEAPLEVIQDVFMFVEDDSDVSIQRVEGVHADSSLPKRLGEILLERGDVKPDDLERILSAKKPLGELLVEQGMVAQEHVASALAEQKIARSRIREDCPPTPAAQPGQSTSSNAASIRVPALKLDSLVDLVGELVIVQARINQVVQERRDTLLMALSEELERLCDDLRDATLGIRMLTIGATFSKFRRLVRDLSEELHKEVDLVTSGEETELDKTVIERLGDPLVHLLRNSLDHGIETPQEREDAGKPRRGTIRLEAVHSGGEVHIHIVDDGRGIDTAKVRARAVERGLMAADADVSDSEIFDCIFQAGFSTAQSVTSVSGRGVGMDVVKRAIEALRGSIEISSTQGEGTRISIKLPLTLAIIDGLEVQVGDDYYVIPLTQVEECVEMPDKADDSREKILNLRGDMVPYIKLRQLFSIPGASPEIEQIVVVRSQGSRVGIVVDTVIGELQTVIKSLGRVYRDVQGISGATIKGDGSMALILDISQLLHVVTTANK